MSYRQEGLQKTMYAGAAVAKNRIVKFDGTTAETVIQGAAATDLLIGVSDNIGAASGETLDVILDGIALVVLGGNVTQGGPVTSDADGKGVAAAPAATASNRIIGYAMEGGVSGDIIGVLLRQSSVTNGANS